MRLNRFDSLSIPLPGFLQQLLVLLAQPNPVGIIQPDRRK